MVKKGWLHWKELTYDELTSMMRGKIVMRTMLSKTLNTTNGHQPYIFKPHHYACPR